MENLIKMDDLGVSLFLETSIYTMQNCSVPRDSSKGPTINSKGPLTGMRDDEPKIGGWYNIHNHLDVPGSSLMVSKWVITTIYPGFILLFTVQGFIHLRWCRFYLLVGG